MEFIDNALIEYAIQNSSDESNLLKDLRKQTHQKILHPRMLSSTIQGRFLSFISKIKSSLLYIKQSNIFIYFRYLSLKHQ